MLVYEAPLIPSGAAILRKTGAVPIADCRDDAGGPLNADPVAPAAKQMGAYVGQRIATHVAAGNLPGPFTYHHQGDLATIGRKSAKAGCLVSKLMTVEMLEDRFDVSKAART